MNLTPEPSQIYYIFVFSTVGRSLVPFLRQLGLNCTEPQSNLNQVKVSTLIFFENIFLELFWLTDQSHTAQFDTATELNFLARANWLETGASPFGFGLSYQTDRANLFTSPIVESGVDETIIQFSSSDLAHSEEPICYVVPDYVATRNRLNRVLATTEEMVAQELGMRQLTYVKLHLSSDHAVTTSLLSLATQNILDIEYRKSPLLELTFDDGNQKRYLDLRPLIPIILRY